MPSKGKVKLKKKELLCGCKVINMEAFAYDIFVYSANKFGVPEGCLSRWEGVTNDYGRDNFIEVVNRLIFELQITRRHDWYKLFKRGNESNKFKSFGEIKSVLPRILRDTEGEQHDQRFLHRFSTSLAVINELILFLYTENCSLYLNELAKFWWAFWLRDKKIMDDSRLLEDFYLIYNNRKMEDVEVFFNQFIPAHCIPYSEMSVKDIFKNEFHRLFNVPEKNPEEEKRKLQSELSSRANLIRAFEFQAETYVDTPERYEASAIDTPRNPGLGIRGHDAVLRNAMETDAATSHQNLPSTSQETKSERRRSISQKGKRKKKTGSCSNIENLEQLNIGLSAVDAATSPQNIPSTSQETESERKRSTSQKGKQKKKTGSSSSVEDLERLNIGLLRVDAATSPQNLPSTSRQETVSNPIETSSQKKATSLYSEEGFGGLRLGFAKASHQNLPRTSRQETVSNPIETSSQKEEQKKATSRSSEEE